jgi:hypothetical protein
LGYHLVSRPTLQLVQEGKHLTLQSCWLDHCSTSSYAVTTYLGSFFLQSFANIKKQSLKQLTQLKRCDVNKFKNKILELAISTTQLLVPVIHNDIILKIKLVTLQEYHSLQNKLQQKPYVTKTHGYLFAAPGNQSNESKAGVMVSCWAKHPLVTKLQLSYEFTKGAIGVFGNGHGQRDVSETCAGMNMYFKNGGRDTWRPHPSPFIAAAEVGLHQYFNNDQRNDLYHAMIRRMVNELSYNIQQCARLVNPELMTLVDDTCDRGILTTGAMPRGKNLKLPPLDARTPLDPPDHKRFSNTPTYGFVNTSHVDTNDMLTKSQAKEWQGICQDKKWTLCEKFCKFHHFCLPTTCGYQLCFSNESDKQDLQVQAFFSMEGLGLAVSLEDGLFHHFMAGIFSHRTCLPTATKLDTISCHNSHEFQIVAWGTSGGRKEVNAKKKKKKTKFH